MYKDLREINVVEHVEQKNGLNYLSWAWAWDTLMTKYPDAVYEIKTWDEKPYLEDSNLGYLVMTRVRIGDIEREMWLPVMDYKNKAIPVGTATMFDINKTIMRCLVKNLAMFGLGISLYAGEDLPEIEPTPEQKKEEALNHLFKSGKHANETIKEIYEAGDIEYLQDLLDNAKVNPQLKEKIKIATGLEPRPEPSAKEQTEILFLTNEINELLSKVEEPDKILKGRKTKGMGLADLIILKNELEKEVK